MKLESPKERLESIRAQVERDFAEHVVTLISDTDSVKCWKCVKPGTWMYGFYVTVIPGFVFIAGDIGEIVFQPTHPKAIDFVLDHTDVTYQLGKAVEEFRNRDDVSPYLVREGLADMVRYYVEKARNDRQRRLPEDVKVVCRALRSENYSLNKAAFYELIAEYVDFDPVDFPSITVPEWSVLYRVFALQWFGRQLKQQELKAA